MSNDYYLSSTGGTVGTTWQQWTCSSGASTDADTWSYWTSGASTGTPGDCFSYPPLTIQLPSEEELRVRAENECERLEKTRRADERAESLLREFLTPEQLQGLEQMTSFVIRSELGNQYRIRRGNSQNIDELDEAGNVRAVLCAAPLTVPEADAMLTQMLMLQADEAEFLRIANRFPR